MKTEKIVWGLTLVFVGTILLLDNFGIINFYWRSVWHFWPLILVLVGLNLVFGAKKSTPTGTLAMILVTCLVLGFVAYVGITRTSLNHWNWSADNDHPKENHSESTVQLFSETYTPGTKRAKLYIYGGATNYEIKDTTDLLFNASVKQSFGQYTLSKTSSDSIDVLRFKMQGKKSNWNMDEVDANRAAIQLNTRPVWDIHLEMGAGKADFDLSAHQIAQLGIKGGAAGFKLKMGEPLDKTMVIVETGIAEVEIAVPSNAACLIRVNTGLSNKYFNGFEKQADGTYTTPGYQLASRKMIIYLKGGLSDFEVKRY